MTFVTLSTEINKQKNASRETRNFSSENLQKFKTNLQQLTWDSVLQSVDVNVKICFIFYTLLFSQCVQLKFFKFGGKGRP
jgi:hypothetical protein